MKKNILAIACGIIFSLCLFIFLEFFAHSLLNSALPAGGPPAVPMKGPLLAKYKFALPTSLAMKIKTPPHYKAQRFGMKPDPSYFHFYRKQMINDLTSAQPNFRGLIRGVLPNKEEIYKIKVSTDENGYRIWPEGPKNLTKRKKHIIFMGCSYTWGAAINDSETFISKINASTKETTAYNRGFMGEGPTDTLKKIRTLHLIDHISQPQGIAAYVFMYDHIKRALGAMSVIGRWHTFPTVAEEIEPGKFETYQRFDQTRPLWTFFMQLLSKSNILQYYSVDFPILTYSHFQWFARLIKNIETEYYVRYGKNNQFVFIFFPERPYFTAPLKAALEEQHIQYLDYTHEWAPDALVGEAGLIEYDGHPTAKVHKVFADMLIQDLHIK